jgi:hypothetical protein
MRFTHDAQVMPSMGRVSSMYVSEVVGILGGSIADESTVEVRLG